MGTRTGVAIEHRKLTEQCAELKGKVDEGEKWVGHLTEQRDKLQKENEQLRALTNELGNLVNDPKVTFASVGDGPATVLRKAIARVNALEHQLKIARDQFAELTRGPFPPPERLRGLGRVLSEDTGQFFKFDLAPAKPKQPDPAEWREVNVPYLNMLRACVDPTRLVGLEVEVEGKVYLVGDVNPDGGQFGRINQAFPLDSIVKRARVAVKR